jgi:hypothetical protein
MSNQSIRSAQENHVVRVALEWNVRGLDTHVADVANLMIWENLRDFERQSAQVDSALTIGAESICLSAVRLNRFNLMR